MQKENVKTSHFENSLNLEWLFYEQLLFLIAFINCFIFLWQGIFQVSYSLFKKIAVYFLKAETYIITSLSYKTSQKTYTIRVL
jgi:hypothetical protein